MFAHAACARAWPKCLSSNGEGRDASECWTIEQYGTGVALVTRICHVAYRRLHRAPWRGPRILAISRKSRSNSITICNVSSHHPPPAKMVEAQVRRRGSGAPRQGLIDCQLFFRPLCGEAPPRNAFSEADLLAILARRNSSSGRARCGGRRSGPSYGAAKPAHAAGRQHRVQATMGHAHDHSGPLPRRCEI